MEEINGHFGILGAPLLDVRKAHLSAIREEHRVQKKRGKWETLACWILLFTETKKQQFCIFWHSCDFELYTGATELPYPNLQS